MYGILNEITHKYLCGYDMKMYIFFNKKEARDFMKNLYPFHNNLTYKIVKLKSDKIW